MSTTLFPHHCIKLFRIVIISRSCCATSRSTVHLWGCSTGAVVLFSATRWHHLPSVIRFCKAGPRTLADVRKLASVRPCAQKWCGTVCTWRSTAQSWQSAPLWYAVLGLPNVGMPGYAATAGYNQLLVGQIYLMRESAFSFLFALI